MPVSKPATFPRTTLGVHIAELQDILISWKLNSTGLVAITTDNGTNVVKAVQLNKWLRMQCFGHRVHLAIGECNIGLIDIK